MLNCSGHNQKIALNFSVTTALSLFHHRPCPSQIRRLIIRSLEDSAESAQVTLHTIVSAAPANRRKGSSDHATGAGAGPGTSLALPHAMEALAQRMVQSACDACLKVHGVHGVHGLHGLHGVFTACIQICSLPSNESGPVQYWHRSLGARRRALRLRPHPHVVPSEGAERRRRRWRHGGELALLPSGWGEGEACKCETSECGTTGVHQGGVPVRLVADAGVDLYIGCECMGCKFLFSKELGLRSLSPTPCCPHLVARKCRRSGPW